MLYKCSKIMEKIKYFIPTYFITPNGNIAVVQLLFIIPRRHIDTLLLILALNNFIVLETTT